MSQQLQIDRIIDEIVVSARSDGSATVNAKQLADLKKYTTHFKQGYGEAIGRLFSLYLAADAITNQLNRVMAEGTEEEKGNIHEYAVISLLIYTKELTGAYNHDGMQNIAALTLGHEAYTGLLKMAADRLKDVGRRVADATFEDGVLKSGGNITEH